MDIWWQGDVSAFDMLSRSVIAFLPRSKHVLISWLHSLSRVILDPHPHLAKIKSVTVSTFSPSLFHEVMELDVMILVFLSWVLSQLFHFPLTLIKRFFDSSLFSAIRVVSSAYLRLLIFLLAFLIPVCDSSSLAFCMIYST